MIVASRAVAHATSAARRSGGRTPPVGYWWAAVTTTASASLSASRSTRSTFVSTGMPIQSRPASWIVARYSGSEVEAVGRRLWDDPSLGGPSGLARGDPRGAARSACEIALRDELLVCLD